MRARLLLQLRRLLDLPARLEQLFEADQRAVGKLLKESSERESRKHREAVQSVDAELHAVKTELAALRTEFHDRMLQYHLQLGRVGALLEGRAAPAASFAGRLPLEFSAAAVEVAHNSPFPPEATSDEWLTLERCPACATTERTVVCEWNKLLLLDTAPDARSSRYDYAVCHGCGILYATERPHGRRYQYLLDHFEDVIDKNASSPLLNPSPLSEEDRERYRRLIARGVFVSEHEGGEYLDGVFKDRLDNAGHVDLLGSLVDLRRARVLEIRPRAGTILHGLRRHYDADVFAMPIWESQQFILRELYGVECSSLIDFDQFTIPFDGPFDLIACNHMFNHAVRLDRFLSEVRSRLRPGGHVYLYNEIDDAEFLESGQSMIATMNPLHFQASDRPSLARALQANGFDLVFLKGRQKRNMCLARAVDRRDWAPIPAAQLTDRIAAYQRARDRAVLRLPERIRPRVAASWPAAIERAVATGVAQFDETGSLRVVKEV